MNWYIIFAIVWIVGAHGVGFVLWDLSKEYAVLKNKFWLAIFWPFFMVMYAWFALSNVLRNYGLLS